MSDAHCSTTLDIDGAVAVAEAADASFLPGSLALNGVARNDTGDGDACALAPAPPATTTPPARRNAAASAATSRNISTAATRTTGDGLHNRSNPAASGLSVPRVLHSTHAAVLSLVDALELLSDSPRATRHAAHASLIVAAADDATSTSVNATPGDAFTAECGRSNVPAAPWTIASLVAGVAATARRIASPAAARTDACGFAHSGVIDSPSAAPRHASGTMNGTHRSNATATATASGELGFEDAPRADATPPSFARKSSSMRSAAICAPVPSPLSSFS
eukprot:31314-Pelagococcus_subviridis.AAC.1